MKIILHCVYKLYKTRLTGARTTGTGTVMYSSVYMGHWKTVIYGRIIDPMLLFYRQVNGINQNMFK